MKTRLSCIGFIWCLFWLTSAAAGTIELPQTGQISCYDASGTSVTCVSTRQDADTLAGIALPSPRFTDNNNGTVTDHLTGLMWTQDTYVAGQTKTWQQSLDYVAGMNSGANNNYGYTDWRLPNIIELLSLVDHERNSPALTTNYPFSNVKYNPGTYYSSTTALQVTTDAWVVDLINGSIGRGIKTGGRHVWPVRGGSGGMIVIPKTGQTTSYATGDDGDFEVGVTWPSSRFIDNGDDTVSDRLTGLMWTKNSNLSSGTWQQSLDYVDNMNSGVNSNYGHNDWRLPNAHELRSLVNLGSIYPALVSGHPFTNIANANHWSSTNLKSTPTKAWNVNVYGAFKFYDTKSASARVWPVRNTFTMKLPLPGNKAWLLTVETGGQVWCNGGTDTYHTGSGYYSLDFDDYSSQNGAETSVPIYAAASGTIDSGDYGYDASGYGHWVKINHGNGYKTLYGHMTAETLITSGTVNQGDQLGTVGSTGCSGTCGTHLHFQIYYDESSANTVTEIPLALMEGLTMDEYTVGCNTYYPSTNTQ